MDNPKTEILDFTKLEDLFFCIEVLTRARFSINSGETDLAADIDRMLASFTAISQNPPPSKSEAVSKKSVIDTQDVSQESLIDDYQKSGDESTIEMDNDDGGIIDLLTGEKIR